ncbi:Ribosome maturation protein [Sparassis crispa]|uniref:Ribosome maturation protein SDO1 n=1 Tax=Sparassis crispa TaxID=139825 RepID=A0A401G915_9APHY|nr:Ribosome maturation protein [Sparassis crispa]GBE78676.1 Ribosome maturation protein [Sparassis crispa]
MEVRAITTPTAVAEGNGKELPAETGACSFSSTALAEPLTSAEFRLGCTALPNRDALLIRADCNWILTVTHAYIHYTSNPSTPFTMPIQQPSNQIKLTNVSIVRLKKGGKRFEIACYKNKVQEWRSGVETDIDDVMQISNVFINVSKGELAKSQDLQKAFGTTDTNTIVKEILKKGELQVGEKEREHDLTSIRKEIATLVAEKCVDPATQKRYPVGIIEKAMDEAGFSIRQGKNAKSLVSECIKLLQTESKLPIQRARMRVSLNLPTADAERLRTRVLESADQVERDEKGSEDWQTILLIDPGQFRVLNELLQKECAGRGRLETISFAAA